LEFESATPAVNNKNLAKRLMSLSRADRTVATDVVATLEDGERSQLLAALAKKHRRLIQIVPRLILMTLMLLIATLLGWRSSSSAPILACIVFLSVCFISRGTVRRLSSAILAVTPIGRNYSQDVGILMQIANRTFVPKLESHASLLLERAVEEMEPGETGGVTPDQVNRAIRSVVATWKCSRQVMSPATDAPVCIAPHTMTMVRLLAKVGNQHQMQILERLAERRITNDTQSHLRDLIVKLLPAWKSRLEGQSATNTLLRSSDSLNIHDVMLRASNPAVEVTPRELLRSTERRP
jgi:hypothetical protein